MIDAGYYVKVIEPKPEGLRVQGVREICSVSTCISEAPPGWVDQWRHNEFGWFNTLDDAWSVVPDERSRYRLFAYRMSLTRFRKGNPQEVTVPADVHPDPIPHSFVSLGFDAVSKSMETVLGFECSPLSCNAMAGDVPANEFCLFPTEAAASAGAKAFSIEEPEPGDYYVVEVLEGRCS